MARRAVRKGDYMVKDFFIEKREWSKYKDMILDY